MSFEDDPGPVALHPGLECPCRFQSARGPGMGQNDATLGQLWMGFGGNLPEPPSFTQRSEDARESAMIATSAAPDSANWAACETFSASTRRFETLSHNW